MNGFKDFIENHDITDQEIEDIASMPCDDVRDYFKNKALKNYGRWYTFDIRAHTASKYAWTLPCKEYIQMIKKYMIPSEPLYDLMAGSGFVAKILRKHDINVKTYDKHLKDNPYGHKPDFDPDIEEKDAVDVSREFSKPVNVLLSWIPYEDNVGEKIVENLPVDSILFLVGEGKGGSTGTDKLWEILNNKFRLIEHLHIPQWSGIHDQIRTYKKIKK